MRLVRWAIAGAIIGIAVVTASPKDAQAQGCSDFTPNNRSCTLMEEYGYCLTNAMESQNDCLADAGGFWAKSACWVAYEVDFYGCAVSTPFTALK